MDKQTKIKIKKLSSDIEKLLFKEIETQLLRLGITRSEFLEETKIKHLNQEEKIKREKIVAFINRLHYMSSDHSIRFSQFLRESVFVWINRLIGIKCMELRGFIHDKNDEMTEIITTRPEYGNHSKWLRDFRIKNPDRTRDKDGGLIASLKKALVKLNSELGFVFDPNYEPGLIFPRYNILLEVINLINNSLDYETYKQDDFLGWVYQYFDEEGKQAIYNRLSITARNKLEDYDIIPYSQLYTDHYIVEFITQNALGAWWRAQYPESKVVQKWDYLLPPTEEQIKFEELELKNIKILDPACGSGHFLLYAFNLLYELYLEEGVIPKNEISHTILENNLYGVDIDRRAVQLASLSLYLKAKEINPSLKISKLNLYSSDIIFQNRKLFEDFKKRIKGRSEDEKELVDSIWQGMRKISALGSLLPIEREIDYFIKSRRTGITQYIDEYNTKWEQWKKGLLDAFNNIIEDALENQNPNELLFARDGMRGVNFLDVFRNRYDIILMNPPYINSRRMNNSYKELLKNYYGKNYYDTAACFIQRALELLTRNGILGTIFPNTLGFLKNFVTIRKQIMNQSYINTYVSLGSNAFSEISGERVKVAIMIIIKNYKGITNFIDASISKIPSSILLNLVKENQIKKVNVEIFKNIDLSPFLFKITDDILELFNIYPPVNSIAEGKVGLQTSDNDRFVRVLWEIEPKKIGKKWFPFSKGGGKVRWYGNIKFFINWENDGYELKNFPRSVIRNESFYFQEGISYSGLGYYVCARYLPPGHIFDVNGSCIFSQENTFYLLAYLNSSLAEYILQQLNPSISLTVGYLGKLPIYIPEPEYHKILSNIAKNCVELKKWIYQFNLTDREFTQTGISYIIKLFKFTNLQKILSKFYKVIEENSIKLEIFSSIIDKFIFNLYNIQQISQDLIIKNCDPRNGKFPLIDGFIIDFDYFNKEIIEYIKHLESISLTEEKLNKIIKSLELNKSYDYIAQEFQINPISIAKIRRENQIIPLNFALNEIENFLTELILEILKEDEDGIVPLNDNSGEKTLEFRIFNRIEILVGEKSFDEFKKNLQEILAKTIGKWLDRDFFKRHIVQFEKRPPIWHISSPNHNFGCFFYYLKLTEDTASKIRSNYLHPEIEYKQRSMKEIQDIVVSDKQILDAKSKKEREKIENTIEDLNQFDEMLKKLINIDYNPDIDYGIKVNLRPWQELQLLAIKNVIKY